MPLCINRLFRETKNGVFIALPQSIHHRTFRAVIILILIYYYFSVSDTMLNFGS